MYTYYKINVKGQVRARNKVDDGDSGQSPRLGPPHWPMNLIVITELTVFPHDRRGW